MRSRRHRRLHPRKQLAWAIIIVVLAGIGIGAGLGYSAIKSGTDQLQAKLTASIQGGQQELEAGKASLAQANAKHDATLVDQARAHFGAAKSQFEAAIQLADDSKLLRYLEKVPSVGDQVRSKHIAVNGIASMGSAISEAGQELANLDAQLIKPAATGPAGRTLLTALDETNKSLVKVRDDLARARAAAATVKVEILPTGQQVTFTKARDTIDSALAGLDEFQRLVPVLTEVLGGNGKRTYLVEQVNPAELRAGGGFIGTYTLLSADQGALNVVKSGDSYDLANPRPQPWQSGFIPQPTPYREVIPDISWSFVDSNIHPDFPSNAIAAIQFAEPRIGKIDAVISMDYYTVAKMLELIGPMAVPGYGTTVDGGNFVAEVVRADIAGTPSHKAILAAIAGPLMARVSALPPDRWPALIADLNTLASQRHLQAYFTNALVQNEIDRVGWSGVVNPTNAKEFFMEVEDNYYGNKDNYFLARHFTITLTRSGGVLHHTVTVDLTNRTPYGSYERVEYRAVMRLFVGGSISGTSHNLRQAKYANPAPPSGTSMLDGWLYVQCCGGHGQAVFQYDTPWSGNPKGAAQIYWQKQPGTITDQVDVVWSDGAGHSYTASGDFAQDRVIRLSPSGVILAAGKAAQATLPSLGLG